VTCSGIIVCKFLWIRSCGFLQFRINFRNSVPGDHNASLPSQDNTNAENTAMSPMGFEPTIPAPEPLRTMRALGLTASNWGLRHILICLYFGKWTLIKIVLNESLRAQVIDQVGLQMTLYTCIREVFGSNHCRDTGHLHWGVYVIFIRSPGKCSDSASIRPLSLPSKSFTIHQSSCHPALYNLDAGNVDE
jgi:hypothetical protein